MIEIKNLSFSYGEKKVLDNISLSMEKGKLHGLLGRNGSGKSTLFKCCLKFLKVGDNNILVSDIDIQNISIKDLSKLIAYLPQDHEQSFLWKVKEIVLMGRTPHMKGVFGLDKDDYNIIYSKLELLDILDLAEVSFNELSGGQKQLVIIARALAQETPIIFLDEPTSALDFSNQLMIWRMLKRISDTGITIVVCTHDPNHILWYCDNVIAIDNGTILAAGDTATILNEKLLYDIYKNKYRIETIGDQKIIYPESFL